jgi:hypothetical protein
MASVRDSKLISSGSLIALMKCFDGKQRELAKAV